MTLIFNDYVYGKQTEKCVFERKQYFIPKGLCVIVIVMVWVYLICFGGGGGGGGWGVPFCSKLTFYPKIKTKTI